MYPALKSYKGILTLDMANGVMYGSTAAERGASERSVPVYRGLPLCVVLRSFSVPCCFAFCCLFVSVVLSFVFCLSCRFCILKIAFFAYICLLRCAICSHLCFVLVVGYKRHRVSSYHKLRSTWYEVICSLKFLKDLICKCIFSIRDTTNTGLNRRDEHIFPSSYARIAQYATSCQNPTTIMLPPAVLRCYLRPFMLREMRR